MSEYIREADVERYLVAQVEKRGGLCPKFTTTNDGWPDRLVMLPGLPAFFVETKRPKGGRLAPLQRYWITKLREMGVGAEVAWTRYDVDTILEGTKETAALMLHTLGLGSHE